MTLLSALKHIVRQHRDFASCQLAGFGLLLMGFSIVEHPASLTLSWLNGLYGINIPPLLWAAWFLATGWVLAWQQHAPALLFFILTLPIAGYAMAQIIFPATNDSASYTPGIGMGLLFVCLQVMHLWQEAVRTWTTS